MHRTLIWDSRMQCKDKTSLLTNETFKVEKRGSLSSDGLNHLMWIGQDRKQLDKTTVISAMNTWQKDKSRWRNQTLTS